MQCLALYDMELQNFNLRLLVTFNVNCKEGFTAIHKRGTIANNDLGLVRNIVCVVVRVVSSRMHTHAQSLYAYCYARKKGMFFLVERHAWHCL